MLIGITSDIHAYAAPFRSALESMKKRNVERIYCLGDLIGYGSEPNETIALAIEYGVECVMGNHEKMFLAGSESEKYNFVYTRGVLTDFSLGYISKLPSELLIREGRVILTHGFPGDINRYFYANSDYSEIGELAYSHIFLGHTHYPMLISYFDKKIINPGSVGQSRDGDKRGSFIVCDIGNEYYEFIRI